MDFNKITYVLDLLIISITTLTCILKADGEHKVIENDRREMRVSINVVIGALWLAVNYSLELEDNRKDHNVKTLLSLADQGSAPGNEGVQVPGSILDQMSRTHGHNKRKSRFFFKSLCIGFGCLGCGGCGRCARCSCCGSCSNCDSCDSCSSNSGNNKKKSYGIGQINNYYYTNKRNNNNNGNDPVDYGTRNFDNHYGNGNQYSQHIFHHSRRNKKNHNQDNDYHGNRWSRTQNADVNYDTGQKNF